MMTRLENHHDNSAPTPGKQGAMAGFDTEFTDIVDYILRITYRIWEGKQVGLCYDYYSNDCPVYTLAGVSIGAEEVTQNTLNTLAAFPDRTLHADAIIWGGDDVQGFHTSHRITTQMTNLGASDMGPATENHAVITVIAHCVVKENRIVEEWLVRDNYSLAEQLGFDPVDVARQKAQTPTDGRLSEWLESERARVMGIATGNRTGYPATPQKSPQELIKASLQNIWNARMVGDVHRVYAENARLHASANRELTGHAEIIQFYAQFLGTLSNIKVSVDYTCDHISEDGSADVAARWTLAGDHTGLVLYGEPTGAPVLILGESHYQIVEGKIIEEWTVFDELSIWTQIFRAQPRQFLADNHQPN